jgi:hypothetical protein
MRAADDDRCTSAASIRREAVLGASLASGWLDFDDRTTIRFGGCFYQLSDEFLPRAAEKKPLECVGCFQLNRIERAR